MLLNTKSNDFFLTTLTKISTITLCLFLSLHFNSFLSQTITVSSNTLSSQTTCEDAVSSSSTFTISGSGLTADIAISVSNTDYIEVSDDGTIYSNSLTLSKDGSGDVSITTIYARIKSKSSL